MQTFFRHWLTFAFMAEADRHQFQLLTKRAERLLELDSKLDWRPNIWMGVSVENGAVVERIGYLRRTRAHVAHPRRGCRVFWSLLIEPLQR